MKKTIKSLVGTTILTIVLGMVSSCSEKIDQPTVNDQESVRKTCPMTFNGGVVGYDKVDTKATTAPLTSTWKDGDKVYVTFYNGTTKVPGEAIYSEDDGWNVNYDGDLAIGSSLKCEVRYFANASFASQYLVSLTPQTEVYESTEGLYDYDGKALTVLASLTPKIGRIRFSGTEGQSVTLTGLTTYTTFSPATNTFYSAATMIKTTVEETGYTPYICATFTSDSRKLGVIGADFAYTRTCTEDVLKSGESGYMAIPSATSYANWRSGLVVSVDGYEFKMIPVSGHADGFFMIGETEVTRELYYKLTNSSTSTNLNYPIATVQYNTFKTAITELNARTGLNFSLPTSSQWLYAAKGGALSQGYTYSGSNYPGDVAWYSGNSSSSVHPVKQLAPNELGIYDMSGNVAEYTTTLYSSSYAYSYYYCGGGYTDVASAVTAKSTSYGTYSSDSYTDASNLGYRLILTTN